MVGILDTNYCGKQSASLPHLSRAELSICTLLCRCTSHGAATQWLNLNLMLDVMGGCPCKCLWEIVMMHTFV